MNSPTIEMERAAAVKRLEAKGEDLSDLPASLVGTLRRVAYGHLSPSLVAKYFQAPLLLSRMASLPLPDQEWLVEQDAVEVAFVTEAGRIDRRRVPLAAMTPTEMRQVFSRDGIRDEALQIAYVRSRELSGRPSPRGRGPQTFAATIVDAGDPIRAAINEAMERHGWSAASLAKKAGVGEIPTRNYLAGRSEIRSGNLVKLMRAAGVSITLGGK